jgi:hypothetical protein
MNEIFELAIKEIPTIGDSVLKINGNSVEFKSEKNFIMNCNSVNIGDTVIKAFYDFNRTKKELFVWIELSSGAISDENKWNTFLRYEIPMSTNKSTPTENDYILKNGNTLNINNIQKYKPMKKKVILKMFLPCTFFLTNGR